MNNEYTTGEDTSFDDFDNFLQEQFMQDEPESVGCKDDFEDNFEKWLDRLDSSEWTAYANKFGQSMRAAGQKEIINAAQLKDLTK